MSDILERLHRNENGIYGPVPIFADAAAEIERLRRVAAHYQCECIEAEALLRKWRKVADIAKDMTFVPIAKQTDAFLERKQREEG